MNWNLIVFIIFWSGIIYYLNLSEDDVLQYTKGQAICTLVTHFIAPLSLLLLYFFTMGNELYKYSDLYKKSGIYLTILYPFLYMIYIYLRGEMYMKDGWIEPAWPYPFLDFSNPFIGTSTILYMLLLTVVFTVWIILHHVFLLFLNNTLFKSFHKKIKHNQ
ncbi:hypothetical protein [Spiroplasma monobiae]|nr:hypothetical protein [Spiroplasma monobiae]